MDLGDTFSNRIGHGIRKDLLSILCILVLRSAAVREELGAQGKY